MELGKHEAQILYEVDKIMELYYRKYTVQDISRVTGITHVDIRDVIETVKQKWREKKIDNHEQYVEEEVATVDLVQRLAFHAFEKSKKHKLNRTTIRRTKDVFGEKVGKDIHCALNELDPKTGLAKKKDFDLGDETSKSAEETTVTNEATPGDKAYLDVILNCVDKRSKLRGTYAPVKSISKVDSSITNNLNISLEHLTEEERLDYKKEMLKQLILSGELDINTLLAPEKPAQEIVYKLPGHLRQVISNKDSEIDSDKHG